MNKISMDINFRRTGFSLIAMHAKLSSKMSVAVDCGLPKSRSVSRRYATSWAAWLAATTRNSAFEVERETLSCQQFFQEMGPPFNNFFDNGIHWNALIIFNSVNETPMIVQWKWIHIWKSLIFLRRITSTATLSAHFQFSSVYPGFSVCENPMIAQ